MEGLIYPGEERVCSGGDDNLHVASGKQNKTDLATRKICAPLAPVEYVDYIYWLPRSGSILNRTLRSMILISFCIIATLNKGRMHPESTESHSGMAQTRI